MESINIIGFNESNVFTLSNHIGASKIDHLFIGTSLTKRISEFKISNEFISSDHYLVEFVVKLRNERNMDTRNLRFKSIDFNNKYKIVYFKNYLLMN